jgi:hypothetical protein
LDLVGLSPADRHDLTAVKEIVRDCDGRVEQTAGVVAQVKDATLKLGT